ncbi:hypothetical protein RN001_001922 [Aquatica leii]|uniref:TTF-type domain-containing protein n=1 Tax=Aquatica leii TaxID=1421715 RepID=A0AAN7PP75_9COLE|nr:hypothetical protein RN001_001922 [Aquatica leii]
MDKKRKRLSGSQYKNRRLMKEAEGIKLSYAMKEFLTQKSCQEDTSTSTARLDLLDEKETPMNSQSLPEKILGESEPTLEPIEPISELLVEPPARETHHEPSLSGSEDKIVSEVPDDSALWNVSSITPKIRQILVERGPNQIKNYDFPINQGRRRFLPSHYVKVLNNGELVERTWLIYSVTKDAVFCFCCMLFDNSSSANEWPKKGYSDWGNLSRALTMHEKTQHHRNAFKAWKELDNRLKQKKTIDFEYQQILNMEIQHWRGRWEVLKKHISQLTLKPLSATRWSSRLDALKPLRFQIGEIYDALFEIIEDKNRDTETKVKARGLAKNINNYKFICGLILRHDVLYEINSVSKLLQSVTVNLSDCVNMLSETIQHLKSYRLSGYDQMKITANEIAESLKCATEFPTESEVRPRRKKRLFDYEKSDDEPLSEETKFKIHFFNYILDITINSLNERFTLLNTHSSHFQFLYDIFRIKDMNDNTLTNYCTSLQSVLTVENEFRYKC